MSARTLKLGLLGLLALGAGACCHHKEAVQTTGDGGDGDSVHQRLVIDNPDAQPPVDPHATSVPTNPRPVVLVGAPVGGAPSATSVAATWVKGDEVFQLEKALVRVDRVVYINNPCPPGAKCITSGIIHNVHLSVTHGDATEAAIVGEAKDRKINGVHVVVGEVRPGPTAEVSFTVP